MNLKIADLVETLELLYRDMSMFDDKKGFYLTCLGILFLHFHPYF